MKHYALGTKGRFGLKKYLLEAENEVEADILNDLSSLMGLFNNISKAPEDMPSHITKFCSNCGTPIRIEP